MELKISNTAKILVVAPHPDDESIGCGGLLAKYGSQCSVLLLTDGGQGAPSNDDGSEDIRDVRKRELAEALKIAGVEKLVCLNAADGSLSKSHDGLSNITFKDYTHIFVPNKWEYHEDHTAAYKLIRKECRRQGAKAKILQYEIWTTLREPDLYLDITEQMEKKRAMVACYASQLVDRDYLGAALGLSTYRGIFPGYGAAESFQSIGLKYNLWRMYSHMGAGLKNSLRRLLKR